MFDQAAIRLNAYRLICLFYANKEIARQSDPTGEFPDPAAVLEREFFARELTHLLLTIAISLRALDDQMGNLPKGDLTRIGYENRKQYANNRHRCMMFDDMLLREVCNKIIHASVVEPHNREGSESHRYDEYMWEAWQAAREEDPEYQAPSIETIDWVHFSGNVRLAGTKSGKQWWQLLEIPLFVDAVQAITSGGDA